MSEIISASATSSWNVRQEEFLYNLGKLSSWNAYMHKENAKYSLFVYRFLNMLGILIQIINVLLIVILNEEQYKTSIKFLTTASTILTILNTALPYNKDGMGHENSSALYMHLNNDIQRILATPREEREAYFTIAETFLKQLSEAEKASPIPNYWARFKIKQKYKDDDGDSGNIFKDSQFSKKQFEEFLDFGIMARY